MDPVLSHFGAGHWWAFALFAVIYGTFIFFVPFYKKSQVKPSGVYLAFVVAFALEMFGVPMSMYLLTWVLGFTLPDGVLWGHTLIGFFGLSLTNLGVAVQVAGALLVIVGWKEIFRRYWSKEQSQGQLVTRGIYRYIRHPQYTGFLLMTLGMIFEWATIPLLVMWPILVVMYYRLAKREEGDMEKEFGQAYVEYRRKTSMFLPLPRFYHAPAVAAESARHEFVDRRVSRMTGATEARVDSATRTNWRRVGLFLAVTFALTWLLDLGIYLEGGLSGGSDNQATVLLFQFQMLIPAATAIALGFLFRGSPQQTSRGQARGFFLFLLAYSVAWLVLGVVALATPSHIPDWLSVCQFALLVIGLPVLLVLRFAGGRSAFAQAGLTLGSPWIWVLGGAGIFLYRVVQAWLNAVLGLGQSGQVAEQAAHAGQPVEVYTAMVFFQAMALGPLLGLVIAFGEEYGWRGLLQSELVKLGRARGVLLVGVIWGIWHAPVEIMGGNYPGYPVLGPLMMVGFCIVMGFILGYAVLKTGSIWVAALLHCVNNQANILLYTLGYTPNDPVFSFGAGIYSLVIGAVIVALILRDPVWRGEGDRAPDRSTASRWPVTA